jgi:hypothetical protein
MHGWISSILLASSRAASSAAITSSTLPGSIMASQVNNGEIDSHTLPCTTVTTMVASSPWQALTETFRGIPQPVYVTWPLAKSSGCGCCFGDGLVT